jgi:formate hydrogenlyase subunit 3/multisubunit Na+/H+ antiporter MnhD subunit
VSDLATTLLDVLGLLLLALGVGAALFPAIGWAAAAASGVVVLAGSQLAARSARLRRGDGT